MDEQTEQMQRPIGSPFGPAATASLVVYGIDLRDSVAMVTGGGAGLGVETVRALSAAGANVVVPVRDVERATAALEGIARVEVALMDLLDPTSIDRFAADFVASGRPLHRLINGAGIMATPLWRDGRGYEAQFATNHLGHFQLVARLWPALVRARGARVVSVSSWGHRRAEVDFEDPNFERRNYEPFVAYGQSKTANVLFAAELDRRGRGEGVRAFSLHPGAIVTGLGRHLSREIRVAAGSMDADGNPIIAPERGLKTVAQGAATGVWCATSQLLDGIGGVYCENCEVSPLLSPEELRASLDNLSSTKARLPGVAAYAVDAANAARLWDLSERLTGARLAA